MHRYFALVLILVGAGAAVYSARTIFDQPTQVTLSSATASPVLDQPGVLHVYLTMQNGAVPNRLISVTSAEAQTASVQGQGMEGIVLPANASPGFSADGAYIELRGVDGPLDQGRLIPIALSFEPSGIAKTRALIGESTDPHMMHRMGLQAAPAQDSVLPEISLQVSEGADGGWDVSLNTTNFTFAPEVEDPVYVPGEGHGHLYLNGLKLQRVYSDKVSIGALPVGTHEIEITLNTNLHHAYETEDGPVAARAKIVVD